MGLRTSPALRIMSAYKPTGGLAPGEVPPPPEHSGNHQQHQESGVNEKRLYVGNLSWDFKDEDMMRQFLHSRGVITMTEVRLPMDRESGMPRGFAFVSFATVADADRAMEALDQTSDGFGRTIDVRRSYNHHCLLYTSPSPRDATLSRMPSSA